MYFTPLDPLKQLQCIVRSFLLFSLAMYQTTSGAGWPTEPCRAESWQLIPLASEPTTAHPIAQPRSKINPLIFKFCFIGAKLACFQSSRGLQRPIYSDPAKSCLEVVSSYGVVWVQWRPGPLQWSDGPVFLCCAASRVLGCRG